MKTALFALVLLLAGCDSRAPEHYFWQQAGGGKIVAAASSFNRSKPDDPRTSTEPFNRLHAHVPMR